MSAIEMGKRKKNYSCDIYWKSEKLEDALTHAL